MPGREPVRPGGDGRRTGRFTLALALPGADRDWLAAFSAACSRWPTQHGCELIGGDTTKGPLNICITVFGEVAPGHALRRDAARPGDDIWISGTLGDARLALAGYWKEARAGPRPAALAALRMHAPTPRVALGRALAQGRIAHAALDISDGLVGDLGHILAASGSAPRSMPTRCRPGRRWRASRRRCGGASRWPAATITNCASPRRRRSARPSGGGAASGSGSRR
jgi:hypothetical protein